MVAIIDYDAGNIKSVENAVRFLGHDVKVTSDSSEILAADHIILPGVGAFGDAMKRLRAAGLEDTIRQAVSSDIPFLGICLGLQLKRAKRAPGSRGLPFFPERLNVSPRERAGRFPRSAGMTFPSPGRAFFLQAFPRAVTSILSIPIIWKPAVPRTLQPAPNTACVSTRQSNTADSLPASSIRKRVSA